MWSSASFALLVFAAAAVCAALGARAVAAGGSAWPWVAALFLGYALAVFALTLAVFAIAWLWRSRRPADRRIGALATLRLVANEWRALLGSAPRMVLYRWLVPDDPPTRSDRPVLLVHGVLCNAGVWTSMRRRLAAAGVGPLHAISYGPPLASIETFAEQLAAKIDEVLSRTGAASVAIVSHSMGGLVTRAYLRRHGGAKVRLAVALAAPYAGSVHAWCFPGTSLSQLRPGNAWLEALAREPLPSSPPIVSIWSWHDSMVAPQLSSRLEGARNLELVGVGHNAMLIDADVARLVIDALRAFPP